MMSAGSEHTIDGLRFEGEVGFHGKVSYIRTGSLIRTATLFVSYFEYWNIK